ncbi:MAG: hypothetical protein ACJ786_41945 [Catenulispora sp.]
MAFGFVAVCVFARVAAVRERGLGAITVLLLGTQVGLHLLFAAAEPASNAKPAMAGMAGMAAERGSGQPMGHLSAGMLCGHVLAALAAAWWLRRGEEAVHRCARRAAARIGAPVDVLYRLLVGGRVGFASPAMVRAISRPREIGGRLIRFVVIRRGPPASALR